METGCQGHNAAFLLGTGAAVVAVVVLLSLANKHASSRGGGGDQRAKVRHLLQTACALGAKATQDRNPVVALVHTATAKAYLDAAQHVSPSGFAQASAGATGDVRERTAELMRKAMQQITRKCPALGVGGADHFVVGAGWVA